MLFHPIQTMSIVTDEVIVSYSGGKDSAIVLDLCSRYFKKVHVFFMYIVPGLSFQENLMTWAEKRYGVSVLRIPHFILGNMLKFGVFRVEDFDVPTIDVVDTYAYVRKFFDCHWIAGGERAKDSIQRNAQLKKSGSINKVRGRFFPIMYWDKAQVFGYIKRHKLRIAPEAKHLGHSFRALDAQDLLGIKRHYPSDYEKVKASFPFIEAEILHHELATKKQASKV